MPAMGVLIYPHTRFEGHAITSRCRASVQHFSVDEGADVWPEVLRRLAGRRRGFELVHLRRHEQVRADIERAISLAFEVETDTLHDTRVALLTLILGQLQTTGATVGRSQPQIWDHFDAWLRQRVAQPPSVKTMAQQVGLSLTHFSHRFREVFGVSPGRHLHRLRLQEAMRLLRETDLPIKAVAQHLGYPNLPNFYRAFRKAAGTTPARYRQHHMLRG